MRGMELISLVTVGVAVGTFIVGVPAAWQYWTWERRALWRAERNQKGLQYVPTDSDAALLLNKDSHALTLRIAATRRFPTTMRAVASYLSGRIGAVGATSAATLGLIWPPARAGFAPVDWVLLIGAPIMAASYMFVEDEMKRIWRERREWVQAQPSFDAGTPLPSPIPPQP
ncbi:hypothetical protein A0W34_32150 (plasmid) [Rhodococcus sp. BH4]|nr:hypothetical protein A0W34_32150 [Rhodococcus sp. BH4]